MTDEEKRRVNKEALISGGVLLLLGMASPYRLWDHHWKPDPKRPEIVFVEGGAFGPKSERYCRWAKDYRGGWAWCVETSNGWERFDKLYPRGPKP